MPVIDSVTVADCACCGTNPTISFACLSRTGQAEIAGNPPFSSPTDKVWYRVIAPSDDLINERQYTAGDGCPAIDYRGTNSDISQLRISSPYYTTRMLQLNGTDGCTIGGAGSFRSMLIPSSIYGNAFFSESLGYTTATYSTLAGGTVACGTGCNPPKTIGYADGDMVFTLSEPWTFEDVMADGASSASASITSGPTEGTLCYGSLTAYTALSTDAKWGDWRVRIDGTAVQFTLTCGDLQVGENYRATVTYRRCDTPSGSPGGDWASCSATLFNDSYEFTATSTPYFITDSVPLVEDYYTGIVGAAIEKL